jgi:cytochrome P450
MVQKTQRLYPPLPVFGRLGTSDIEFGGVEVAALVTSC